MTTSNSKPNSPCSKPPKVKRDPMQVMFLLTSMPVGGAETLLANLVRKMDRTRFAPEICCLKEPGPLGEELAKEIPVHANLLACKYDLRVLPRLVSLFLKRDVGAVVTVGAGDKMFWGRLAAKLAGVPVVVSALHSTGWPDGVGRLNRLLTPLTDAFIGVAPPHGRHLVENERFPEAKVHVIPNGIDIDRFRPSAEVRERVRQELGITPEAHVCGLVAALRPEKNHEMLIRAAETVTQREPNARFLLVGDGPRREALAAMIAKLGLQDKVIMLGNRSDVPDVLAACDVLALTSHNEANPVSILEAMACNLPVVATRVGSVPEMVRPGESGMLVDPDDEAALAEDLLTLYADPALAARLGQGARELVERHGSLEIMVSGYQRLLDELYRKKRPPAATAAEPQGAMAALPR